MRKAFPQLKDTNLTRRARAYALGKERGYNTLELNEAFPDVVKAVNQSPTIRMTSAPGAGKFPMTGSKPGTLRNVKAEQGQSYFQQEQKKKKEQEQQDIQAAQTLNSMQITKMNKT